MQFCRERLNRILSVLERQGGAETVRQLTRRFSIFRHEIEEAESLGFIVIEKRKPRTGRPSKIASLSECQAAKLPPWRRELEKPIKATHQRFAMFSVCTSIKGGSRATGFPGYVEAYRKAFPSAASLNGAYASCSRLLRHPHVFAARQWYYAETCGEIPNSPFPDFESEIWTQLEVFGSWRARFKPTSKVIYREQRW